MSFDRHYWESPEGQKELAKLHKGKQRPLCPCQDPPIPMYIAKCGDRYIVKRMPETGANHSQECASYDPPPGLSGLSDVIGTAIVEDDTSGLTELRFGFSLMKLSGKALSTNSSEKDTVKADGRRLTLKSTLHFLWEEAGLNKWVPGMTGKRNWYVVRKYILQAADSMIAKHSKLTEMLYLPEVFSTEQKNAINHRRLTFMQHFMSGPGVKNDVLSILVGEVKKFEKSINDKYKLIIKHCPDFPFLLNGKMYEQIEEKWKEELSLWDSFDETHMICIATFRVSPVGVATIEEIALMPTTENWIPYENVWEKTLIEQLTLSNRRFIKGLRYNLSIKKPLASVVLSDTAPAPTAMYIVPIGLEDRDEYLLDMSLLRAANNLASWEWDLSDVEQFEMPSFPVSNEHGLSSAVVEEQAEESTH